MTIKLPYSLIRQVKIVNVFQQTVYRYAARLYTQGCSGVGTRGNGVATPLSSFASKQV